MRAFAVIGVAMLGLMGAGQPVLAAKPPADPLVGFAKSCQTQMYMSQAACGCVVSKAKAQLDSKEIVYLSIPGAAGPEAAAAAKEMTGAELANVDKFMHTAVPQCEGAK
ncbi:MAG: hypothetical protein P4M09_08945 [Devosia sp.]|nr:hypothetical protein [Devosia sp.]